MVHEELSSFLNILSKSRYNVDWVTLFGGMIERNGGIAEYTEYSKIRKILNILKRGIYGIFSNAEYTNYSKTRDERRVFKKKKDIKKYTFCP